MKSRVISIFLMLAILVGVAPESYAKISLKSSSKSAPAKSSSVKSSSKAPSVSVKSSPMVVKSPKTPTVSKAPKSSAIVSHKGNNYYRHNSKYYVKSGPKYVRTPPPFGLRVAILPALYTAFVFNNMRYYCSDGVIYSSVSGSNEYEVVEPQIGMIVPALPKVNVSQIMIDDKIYFEFEGYLYKQIPTEEGLMYEVVGSLSL
ncbi:MAG: DUF6515 family protein [Rikenellaceae bacterium]